MAEENEKMELHEGIDWLLQLLVGMTNQIEIQYPITLNVGGIIISGYLVNGRDFINNVGEIISSPFEEFGTETAQLLKTKFDELSENIYQRTNNEETEEAEQLIKGPIYIHLRDARIWHGKTRIPSNKGVFWRGRLNAVDGFSLGILESDD